MYVTDRKLSPDGASRLKGFNYPDANLAYQAWEKWSVKYLEYCLSLNAASKLYQKYEHYHELS
ncbi:hypothetical protein PCC8801_3666 [Rippkaea orientalis PCC 8801]|uniref:Uncharacterized protein n=1 Tax=Rippkaea orientalis (strain PCC 8801 / RF-1) TaxID=41431 RepID=B7K2S7_RIPO1|nr:hypothetical protein [Rippkaea orientalis]ACK67628.1 hypothetical protein PCC8801_3666 [Rippkaea orientalis PCC 8801]